MWDGNNDCKLEMIEWQVIKKKCLDQINEISNFIIKDGQVFSSVYLFSNQNIIYIMHGFYNQHCLSRAC